ncbi:MAG: hypothetical protein CMI60_22415 [Parvibaculum sp.]|nr:hypothetical protein [Parvibaculum sp.]|tara:strand:+ start:185 stop:676 length:492 start_codon:yes stop_codon:yes gene_type:complete
MALGDNTLVAARGNDARGRGIYFVQHELDYAVALSDKGSALAASDVIPVIAVPAGSVIMNAGIEVVTAASSGTTTLDLGTGVDPDCFVDGFDGDSGTAAGTFAQNAAAFQPLVCTAADNIDVTIASQSGTALTTGKIRVFAMIMDVSDIGVVGADEVDRDTLA